MPSVMEESYSEFFSSIFDKCFSRHKAKSEEHIIICGITIGHLSPDSIYLDAHMHI